MLRGLPRIMHHVTKQARPMTPQLLRCISQQVDHTSDKQVVVFMALLVGFFIFLCRSNLALTVDTKFSLKRHLLRSDVRWGQDLVLVHIKWTKTLQFQRPLLLPLVRLEDKSICPVFWLGKVLRFPGLGNTPLFQYFNTQTWKQVCITAHVLQRYLKKWVLQVGENSNNFSLHSPRRGGATWGFCRGLPAPMIKALGNWALDTYLRYLDADLDLRLTAAQEFSLGL